MLNDAYWGAMLLVYGFSTLLTLGTLGYFWAEISSIFWALIRNRRALAPFHMAAARMASPSVSKPVRLSGKDSFMGTSFTNDDLMNFDKGDDYDADFPPVAPAAYLSQDQNERSWRDFDFSAFTISQTMATPM